MPVGLTFNIFGNDASASSTLRRVEGQADQSAQSISSKFKGMAGTIGKSLGALGALDFLKDSFAEAQEAQKVGAQTAAVIKSTGGAAHVSAGQVSDLSGAISQKVGIDDEAIQSGQNMLLTFTDIRNEVGKGNDIFNQATSIMTDMSVATGQSMTGAATMLGKALNDPVAGISKLTKVGVTFTEQQKEQIKQLGAAGDKMGAQKIILGELNKEFGGSAAAQATSADKMKVAFGNLQEQVGTALMPIITMLADFMTNTVIPAFGGVTAILQKNWSWLKYVAIAAAGVWVAMKGYGILTSMASALGTIPAKAIAAKGAMLAAGDAATAMGTRARASGALVASGALAGIGAIVLLGSQIAKAVDGTHTIFNQIASYNTVSEDAKSATEDWTTSLKDSNGALTESIRLSVAQKLQQSGLADAASKAGISLDTLTTALTGTKAQQDALITSWANSGPITLDNVKKWNDLTAAYTKAGAQGKALNTVNAKSADTQKQQTDALGRTTAQMKSQKDASDKLLSSIKALSGDKIDAAQAELRFKDGLAEATGQVKENGQSLSDNTTKGRSNREWLLSQLSSLKDVASAQLEAGQSTDVVTKKLGTNKSALEKAAIAAGLSKTQVKQLIDQYGQMPAVKSTKVSAPGAVTAANQVEEVARQARLLPTGGKSVSVSAPGAAKAAADVDTLRRNLGKLPSSVGVSVNSGGQIGVKGGGRYAQGTGFAAGGWAMVGENGPERVRLPRGSRVDTASMTASAMRGGSDRGSTTIHINVPEGVSDPTAYGKRVKTALDAYYANGGR